MEYNKNLAEFATAREEEQRMVENLYDLMIGNVRTIKYLAALTVSMESRISDEVYNLLPENLKHIVNVSESVNKMAEILMANDCRSEYENDLES